MKKDVFKIIKRQNGEKFAKVLRDYHNGIFEINNIENIVKFAGRTPEDAEAICQYLVELVIAGEKQPKKVEDPFYLLDKAGYDAYYADTLEKQNSISKYFKANELLCTFNSSRYKNYYIINAVKKNVDNILRKDFMGKEKRQDEYGTSVISIQVAKKGGFISIKNRYNHTVKGCDNTFNSNPDNIIDGLSAAIQKYFNVSFSSKGNSLPNNVLVVDEKLFKWHQEISGVYFGDKAYVKNGSIYEVLAKNGEFLFDHFIFSTKTKCFKKVIDVLDSFPEEFNKIYGGRKSVYLKDYCIYDGDVMLVGTKDI